MQVIIIRLMFILVTSSLSILREISTSQIIYVVNQNISAKEKYHFTLKA